MKSILISFSFVLAGIFSIGMNTYSQEVSAEDAKKITETAMNYADGFLSGSGERMEKALFPDLRKYAVMKLPNTELSALIQSSYSGLIEMSAAKVGVIDEATRNIKVKPLAVFNDKIACAQLTSSQFNDYLHMVKVGDNWKIVNVLWAAGSDSRSRPNVPVLDYEEHKPQIIEAAEDFFKGLYTGQADLLKKVLNPNFTVAKWTTTTADANYFINRDGADLMIAVADAKMALLDKDKWNFEIHVLDYMDGMATVMVKSPQGEAYLHLGYIDGSWQMVNMLQSAPPRVR